MKRFISIVTLWILITVSCGFAASEPSIAGRYFNKADKEVLTLYPNGTFYLKLRKQPADPAKPFLEATGTYKTKGEEILLELEGGGEASGTIKGNTFIDNEGKTWQKEGTSEPMSVDSGPKKGMRAR